MTANPDTTTEHGPRVLIVDDERHNRQVLEVLLAQEGYVLQTAAGGEEALAAVAKEPPDLILLDVMMPGMDGYQVAGKLKSNPATKHIPIIIVTALDDRNSRVRGLTAGAAEFLTKPVDRAELTVRVKNLLRLKAYGDFQEKYSQILEEEVGLRTEELVESELLYRSTFDAAPVGIVHVGLDGQWLRVNQRLCALLGYSREELQSPNVQELTQSQEAPGEADGFLRMAAGTLDRHAIEEKRYRRRDGSYLWARINMSVHRDVEGRSQHFILVIEDITEKRALEAEVRQSIARLTVSEERYRTLLESADDAIAVLTPDGIVREMNQRWVTITGRTREDLIGRHVRDVAPSGKDGSVQIYDLVFAALRSPPVPIATNDGSNLMMEFSTTTIQVGGEPLVLTIGRDVTERRKLEEQLQQAQKLEVIGQLAGGIAHDFNNLLTAILGFSEIIIADLPANDPTLPDILEIKKAGERAAGLTRQLLAFSRKQILAPNVLDINDLITSMEPMLRRLIVEHVNLTMSLEPHVGTIKIDPTQFEQIIINLAVNAADAMPRGGKLVIETSAVTVDEHYQQQHLPLTPGPYVLLAVSDTGVGMDDATSRHMFEPFFTTKEVGKGTGLGLSTVYGIVKQSGGDIWVDTQPGRGSIFRIYLPRVTAPAPALIKTATGPGAAVSGSETILLVEDDEAVRRLARQILERTGYRVLEAGNPNEAVRMASEHSGPIDLLLSDVIMPDSEGPPLFVRLLKAQPRLRALYMSGYADEAIARQGVIVEGTPFLQKPFTPMALNRKVRDVLDEPQPEIARDASPVPAAIGA